jgi:Flp pilus assembly protein TadD
MIHAAKNQPGRAITLFRRYLRLHPDDAGARFQLGELLFANGRREEAHTEYARVKKAVRTTSFSTP